MAEHHVVLVLVAGRSSWHRSIAGLADAGLAPLALQRCLSADELLSQATACGRAGVAVVDANALGVGRDLFARLHQLGWGALVVDGERSARRWTTLGADATVSPDAPAAELARLAIGIAKARPERRVRQAEDTDAPWERLATTGPEHEPTDPRPRGRLVCVLGPGGTGTSTVARAIAEAAADREPEPSVLLADFARRAHQALLHGMARESGGLDELLDLCRLRVPQLAPLVSRPSVVRYHLLTGRRRPSAWASWGPFARRAALETLLGDYDLVVADCDGELEGSAECGSPDVEQRHALQRACVRSADLVVVVGREGLGGLASLLQLVADLRRVGDDDVPIAVVLRASASARSLRRASRRLVARRSKAGELPEFLLPPIPLPEVDVERSVIDGCRLPATLVRSCVPLVDLVEEQPTRQVSDIDTALVPTAVAPGSLRTADGNALGWSTSARDESEPW